MRVFAETVTYNFQALFTIYLALYYKSQNTNVVLRRISLCGNRSMDTDDDNVNSATSGTTVTLTVIQLCGDIHTLRMRSKRKEEV